MAGWLDATDTFYAWRQWKIFAQRTKKGLCPLWPQGVFKPFCIACGFLFFNNISTFKNERSLFKTISLSKTQEMSRVWAECVLTLLLAHPALRSIPHHWLNQFIFLNDAQFLIARLNSNSQNLVIPFKYSWFLPKIFLILYTSLKNSTNNKAINDHSKPSEFLFFYGFHSQSYILFSSSNTQFYESRISISQI